MPTLTLAHSADADDVFMWWPITGKVDPAAPHKVLVPAVLDTGGFTFQSVPEDIAVLNRRAMAVGDLDITAVSFATLPYIWQKYRPTFCGSSFGDDWGPKLVRSSDRPELTLEALLAETATHTSRPTLAIPGKTTSAWTSLCVLLGRNDIFEIVETPFDKIIDVVAAGKADLGLLIHESQLTFADHQLMCLLDLGVEFKRQHSLPLPLGANAIRTDFDSRFGPGTQSTIVSLLSRSITHALAHRAESINYARDFSMVKATEVLDRYIRLYVNRYTIDARPDGQIAAALLLSRAAEMKLLPPIERFEMFAPD